MRIFSFIACAALTACASTSSMTSLGQDPERAQERAQQRAQGHAEFEVRRATPRISAPALPRPEIAALAVPTRPVTLDGFAFDLGVGEAPYDDGPKAFDRLRRGRPGFSDSLIRVSYEHAIGGGAYLVGSASAFRVQDRQVFHALQDLDMSWAVIGVRISF